VNSEVDFYTQGDVCHECSNYSRQYVQMKQLVRKCEQQNIQSQDDTPEFECHGDVPGIEGRRMMENVTNGGWLIQTWPVHGPTVKRVFNPVRP
jgi:hypothetical protein